MTNINMRLSAMQQSAIDLNCKAADFVGHENKIVISKLNSEPKKYFKKKFDMARLNKILTKPAAIEK